MSKLTAAERNRLPSSDFGVPSKRKYPIENKSHARNALARVSRFGTSKEKEQVRRRVHEKFPSIHERKGA